MEFFLQLLVIGLSIGFLYALAALGFVMIFKSSSVLNFAHGELLAIGAFLFLVLSAWAKVPIVVAFAVPGVYMSLGAILVACTLIAVAAKLQPEPPEDEHH